MIYEAIEKKALPIIQSYHNDLLVHDKRDIRENHPGIPFLHFTRETGTLMMLFHKAEEYPAKGEHVKYLFATATRKHILTNSTIELFETIKRNNMDKLIQHFDGKKVREVTFEQAEKIAHEYVEKIRNEWAAWENPIKMAS